MENNAADIILVPWDFTDRSNNALRHAVRICGFLHTKIVVLHVLTDKTHEGQALNRQHELSYYMGKVSVQARVDIRVECKVGSIFSTITDYANQINARLVIMGTHGMKGLQRLTGSWAYKVLLGAKMPFLIVKERPVKQEEFTDIVFPLDFRKENLEKVEAAIYLNRTFHTKIHIYKAPLTNKKLLRQTNVNMNIALQLLAKENVDYEIYEASESGRFDNETIRFAHKIHADLILVVTSEHTVKEKLFGEHEQFIIDNDAGIPVMCLNPSADYREL